LIQLEPEKIRQELLQQGGITAVDVDRALVPPRLTIRIDDRPPVAMVISAAEPDTPQGFLDPSGKFTPIARYRNIARPTPKLKAILPSSNRCSHWEQIYPAIDTSPVAIGVLDCRNSSNLMLQTEIGKVKLGSYVNDRRLAEQIDQLDRLRNWQTSADPHQVDYLDLENPAFPKLQRPQAGTAIIQNSAP
jgi:cell division protein FtsQ